MAEHMTHFDHDAHYASKATKQLEELVKFWEVSIANYHGIHTLGIRELALVKMKLAERIGKIKT